MNNAAGPEASGSRPHVVFLAGNPNAGKTTLFNALSGARARVGNYPGVTVDRKSARVHFADSLEVELVDVPGTYSLTARSPEEQVAVDAVMGHGGEIPDAVVILADATALSRNLYLALQIIESGVPAVIALSMMDVATRSGLKVDAAILEEEMGVPVVPIVATRGEGIEALKSAVSKVVRQGPRPRPLRSELPEAAEADLAELEAAVGSSFAGDTEATRRAYALWALLSVGGDELRGIPGGVRERVLAIQERAASAGRDLDLEIIGTRYALLDRVTQRALTRPLSARTSWTERIDSVLTHPLWGLLSFAFVMVLVFEALWTWSVPLMDGIDAFIGWAGDAAVAVIPPGVLQDLVVQGIVTGVGNVVIFVPQIALLFLFIGFLEDSGYLARVAFLIDRLMKGVGLHGRAFVPLLSGFACAIPAVMATRTIENRRDRLATMLALPLMSCSARLPIYVLVVGVVFVNQPRIFGVFSVGATVLFAMYALSVVATLGAATVLRRTILSGPRPPLVLELPPYRWPRPNNLLLTAWERVRAFLLDAGTIILAITIVLWAALSFPHDASITERFEAERVELRGSGLDDDSLKTELSALGSREAGEQLKTSAAGRLGVAMEPLIEPLGFDWRMGVGIIGAFAAREVFVSTLGIVYGMGEQDEESQSLRDALRASRRADGSPLMTPLAGVSLMVFFVLAAQCMSTIAVVRRESGSWKWPLLMFTYMSALAYAASFIVYQVGSFFGWGLA